MPSLEIDDTILREVPVKAPEGGNSMEVVSCEKKRKGKQAELKMWH
jgi:hypothetical protein